MKALLRLITLLAALMLTAAACGPAVYRDGVYTARSDPDDRGGWGEVTITITNQAIAAIDYRVLDKDGTEKGEDYGRADNQEFYARAQAAVRAAAEYRRQLQQNPDISRIERISGATISYDQLLQALDRALHQAR